LNAPEVEHACAVARARMTHTDGTAGACDEIERMRAQ
jgi:hypothetical protein